MTNKFLHDPNATLDYRWDWNNPNGGGPWLGVGETISTFTVTPPTGITVASSSQTLGIVTAWITGGTVGTIYPIVCHITTSAGRQDDRTIYLTAINR